ncbi:hypothetical protein LOK74_16430 [Brevibacillus humidisoli]|nr:thiamine pyrophosphate-dependent enzyme [Brevibacillus humidisoli]UFJ39632.1 hypothetical protein LOK74_16430 [Brevibacillus humidisoli]
MKATEAKQKGLSQEKARWMYQKMLEIRKFEDAVHDLFSQGKLPGFVHLYAGEEAIAVGFGAHLEKKIRLQVHTADTDTASPKSAI